MPPFCFLRAVYKSGKLSFTSAIEIRSRKRQCGVAVMSILVAVSDNSAPWVRSFARAFQAALPEQHLVFLGEPFDRRAVSYAIAWKPPAGSLANLPALDAVFSMGAGVDFLMQDARLPHVPVFRVAQDDLTFRMSEYVVMHCLMHLRDQRRFDRQQAQKVWNDEKEQPIASEVRVGIMGMGVLGQDAAGKLKVMGFDVAGWSRTPKPGLNIPVFSGNEELDAFLSRTDILVALMPLTSDTRGILNRSLFEKLAPKGALGGPILINVGRGGLQVENDILSALDDRILKAATLDVFEVEPLPAESRLWNHPAITVSPHNSATSEPKATARYIAGQIRRFEAGEEVGGLVDRVRGY